MFVYIIEADLFPSAVYCIGMFALMLLSLVETIVVMYLLEKDSASRDKTAANGGQSSSDDDCNKQSNANFLRCHEGETRQDPAAAAAQKLKIS